MVLCLFEVFIKIALSCQDSVALSIEELLSVWNSHWFLSWMEEVVYF